ncbi:glycosyltransferase [Candidatus Woesearchaeota archaeon]|nr:glycosyltransferase [Candidatus Woesearchaeota archaeon]
MNLSLVVPAYNEEQRIIPTLEKYCSFFPSITQNLEVIVVVNGSTDATLTKVNEFRQKHSFVRTITVAEKIGKGGALIVGLHAAQYEIMGFLDADDAFDLERLKPLLSELNAAKIDVAIASKWKGRSFWQVSEPFTRKIMSRVWNWLTRVFLHVPFRDTQAGAKFFRRDAWDSIPKNFIGRGFEFDIDLLDRFWYQAYRIKEFYVPSKHKQLSTFSVKHTFSMFVNLIRIARQKRPQSPAHYYRAYSRGSDPAHIFYRVKMNKILSFIPAGKSFLDCGCGSGVLPYLVSKKKQGVVWGTDLREDQVALARRLCPQGTFKQGNLLSLNLGRKFDVVNCSDVIEHFTPGKERTAVLESLDRHVAAGGRLITVVPSWFYIRIFERVWKVVRNKILHPFTSFDDDHIHEVVPPKLLVAFYKQKGYRIVYQRKILLGLLECVVMERA